MALFGSSKKKFGEILIEKGLATKEDVESAIEVGIERRRPIARALA